MNPPVNSQPSSPPPSKPPRNPKERIAVWGGIGLLLAIVLLEYRASQGYAQTIEALNYVTANETKETTLAEARQMLAMAPSVSAPVPDGQLERTKCSWFSVFKNGQYEIMLVSTRDKEPLLLAYTTPNPPEEPPPAAAPAAAEGAGPDMASMGGMGMGGMGMGGGGGMGGGPRPPNPVRIALDADEDGSLSAEEIAASPTALAKLDKDKSGSVSAEELTPPAPPVAADAAHGVAHAAGTPPSAPAAGGPGAGGPGAGGGRRPGGRLSGAIDTNEDGAFSAEELAAAPTGLKTLDADSDGKIAAEELRPPGGFGGGPGGPGAGGGGDRPARARHPDAEESPATPAPDATAPAKTDPAAEAPAPDPAAPVEKAP